MIRDRATFRLGKDNTVEIVMHPALSSKPMVFRAFPDDVLAMWPVAEPGDLTDRPATDTAKPAMSTPEKRRKLKFTWSAAKDYFREVFLERGEFRPDDIDSGWQTQADLEREVLKFLGEHDGKEPSESQTRTHVSEWLAEWRAELRTKAYEG